MKHPIARLLERLARLRFRRTRGRDFHLYPYSCGGVSGPNAHRTGERPPRGGADGLRFVRGAEVAV
ncbi:hypothetical protein [Streptomyces sp. NPDC088115]|uniref:hypothetical protein n=1 Tax=unclassified Streptomyces TaxID=2593676 RepID=UPI00380EE5B1